MSDRRIIHVISGTHWDREWRFTADQSLLRLAELMDELLETLEKDEDYICFHLDGGTVIIEDYLAIRPENEQRLRHLIEQGRIVSVKWYTLPEMSTVSPESLIRNLLIGKRMADKFGGSMKAGYTATSYGQISQLPQIYAGFGSTAALSYRGTNKHQVPPICLWESPDGTQIYHIRCFDEVTRTNWFFFPHYELVLNKLPRDLSTEWKAGDWPVHMADEKLYETAIQLKNENLEFNKDKEKILSAIRHLVKQAGPQAIGNNILALDMEDNAVPYVNLPKLIKAMNSAQDHYLIKQSSLDEFVDAAETAVKDKKIPVLKGEMRYGAIESGFNGLLGATHSSRVILKLMNDEAETELIKVAEPLCSFCSMLGGSYEKSLFQRAWLNLLKNHAHDSICGAAIDEAHKDNPNRFRAVTAISRECSRKAAEELWTMIDTETGFKEGDLTLTFFNTASVRRRGVQPLVIDAPYVTSGDFPIEPCSDAGPIIEDFEPDKMVTYEHFDIIDEHGSEIPYALLEREKIALEVERKLDSNAAVYPVFRTRLLMDVNIPAFGYRTYALRPRAKKYILDPQPGPDRDLIAETHGALENEFLKVGINPNGTFNLTDKKTRRCIEGMHYFCDAGSTGNCHIYKKPLRNYTITSHGNSAVVTLTENNKLRGTWKVDITINVPASADLDNRNRSEKFLPMPLTTWITLRKGSKRLEIKTRLHNPARDHRLRVMFPTDIKTDYAHVDGPFDVLRRQIQWKVTGDNMEGHYPFQPMGDFVSLTDGKSGVAFFSKGLKEYEVVDDTRRTLAVTLFRTTRAYMKANRSLFTPEEYERQTGQHCLGQIDFEYAIYPHTGDWFAGEVALETEDFKVPQRIIQGVPKYGKLPASNQLLTITPDTSVRFSAMYKNESGDGYILRVWNSQKEPVEASIKSFMKFKSIVKISMDEEREEQKLPQKGDSWLLCLRKAEIATLLIRL